jgi:hypothetical protein
MSHWFETVTRRVVIAGDAFQKQDGSIQMHADLVRFPMARRHFFVSVVSMSNTPDIA